MKVAALEVVIGLALAACSGGPGGDTTSGGDTAGSTTGIGQTTGTGSGTTSGGCGACRPGEVCTAGECQCDPFQCTGSLTCTPDGRCAYDACRLKEAPNEGKGCLANGDCGCPLFCSKGGDGGAMGLCQRRCNTTADCPLSGTSCREGLCVSNACGDDGGNGVLNGPCNASAEGDGTCVPHSLVVGETTLITGTCVQNGCSVATCELDARRSDGYALCAAGMACVGQFPGKGLCYRLCDPDAGGACGPAQTCLAGSSMDVRQMLCSPFVFEDAGSACLTPALDGGHDGGPEAHEPFSLVPLNPGGIVLSAVEVTTIDYAGYELDEAIQDYMHWIVTSSWFSTVGHSYGVGMGTYVQHYTLSGPAPSNLTGDDVDALLESLLGVDGGLPAPNPNSLYFLFFPSSTVISGGGTSCQDYGGYHTEDVAGTYDVPYAVVPTCSPDLSVVVSHEFAESVTDPFVGSRPAYRFMDTGDPFTYVSQGEIGDLCQGFIGTYEGNHAAQRIWSNDDAMAGLGSPCAPVPPDEVFVNVTPTFSGIQPVYPGTTTFLLTGWSNNPSDAGSWQINAFTLSGANANPMLNATTIGDGQSVSLIIDFPLTSSSGDQTVVEVTSIEPGSGNSNYWPMIFEVQ